MKNKRLPFYSLFLAVSISLFSFVYVNFLAAGTPASPIGQSGLKPITTTTNAKVEDEDVDEDKSATPNVAVLIRAFELARKFVPGR